MVTHTIRARLCCVHGIQAPPHPSLQIKNTYVADRGLVSFTRCDDNVGRLLSLLKHRLQRCQHGLQLSSTGPPRIGPAGPWRWTPLTHPRSVIQFGAWLCSAQSCFACTLALCCNNSCTTSICPFSAETRFLNTNALSLYK